MKQWFWLYIHTILNCIPSCLQVNSDFFALLVTIVVSWKEFPLTAPFTSLSKTGVGTLSSTLDTLEANNQTNNIQWSHQPLKLLMYMTMWAWCSLQCVPPQLHLSTQSYLVKYNTMFLPKTCRVLEAGFSNFMSTLINHAREGADSTKLCRDSQNADIPGVSN